MKKLAFLFACIVAVLSVLSVAFVLSGCDQETSQAAQYHCPMHPTYISDHPGDCPICGMRLVPVETKTAPIAMENDPSASKNDSTAGLAPVSISERGVQLAGVRTAVASRGRLKRELRAYGVVAVDETRVKHVHTKISGYVEKLFVNFTGQAVRHGQPILSIFSPELLASQEEFLRAIEGARRLSSTAPEMKSSGEELVAAARRRLRLFDVPEDFIAEVEKTEAPKRSVTLLSPSSGFVGAKQVFEGQQVEPAMELFTVTDLSRVWIEADFYEYEAKDLKPGEEAAFSVSSDPVPRLRGKIAYIYPFLNTESRTIKVRFDLDNRDLALKPGMYVTVTLERPAVESVVIPDSAVLDSGLRQVVFVEAAAGRFIPREVTLGARGEGQVQVLSGIAEGERVVVKGNFLIDSESRLQSAIGGAGAALKPTDGGSP